METVHVILLNWNQAKLLGECLDSLERTRGPALRIVVVDNASREEIDWERLSSGGRRFLLIRNQSNLGFAGGNNRGIEAALSEGATAILLLNTDTEVEPEFLTPLLDVIHQDASVGAVGPTVVFGSPERLWFAGAALDEADGRPVHRRMGEDPAAIPRVTSEGTYYVTGCCLLARAEVWREVGLLSEALFYRWEDTDWCVRAAARGYRNLYVPGSRITHKTAERPRGADASATGIYFEVRNRLWFVSRHIPEEKRGHFYRRAYRAALRTAADALAGGPRKNARRLRAVVSGLMDFWLGHEGPGPAWLGT